jgi:indole-3-glycerol phosphate synthase
MSDLLTEIIDCKRARLAAAREIVSDAVIYRQALTRRETAPPHFFTKAMNTEGLNIIGEFKRRSPSKGVIRDKAEPADFARKYQNGGAKAVSVLTEQDHFTGSLDDLLAVRMAVSLPLLRKDFIFDTYQVYESAAAGADALLLIVAALDDAKLESLRRVTEDELNMDALVEVHTLEELNTAVDSGAKLIGVNNRDLRTFQVSLHTSEQVAAQAPNGVTLVSESGIETAEDLRRLTELGYKGFLIGETLMRADDPEAKLRSLLATGVSAT